MKDKTRDDIDDLLTGLSEEVDTKSKTNELTTYNPEEELTKSLYGFVESQLQAVAQQESFRSVVVEALIDKIREQEVSVSELLRAYEVISKQTRESGSALLNLFKNDGRGGGSLLGSGESTDEEGDYDELNTKDRVAIDRLARALSSGALGNE